MSSRKSKHRFFVPPPQIKNGKVCIRGTDVWHITKVLRLSQGQKVIVFDGTGREYLVALDRPKRQEVFGFVLEEWEQPTESPLKLSLIQAVPKSDKMDLIVQKSTEIGVNEIIPLNSARSIWGTKTKHSQQAKVHQRLERWSRIGIEAAKQSCRTSVPLIRPVVSIEEFLSRSSEADLKLLLWEEEEQRTLKETLRNQSGDIQSVSVVIGPEGGFTQEESEQFQQHGYLPISLGKRILRTETAGLVVLGILQYEFGDY